MALHRDFPTSPYEIVRPELRWFPADETLREKGYDRLLPPLVAELRKKVHQWRADEYEGVSETSRALLRWWFEMEHILPDANGEPKQFRYYFCQREAVETVIYLYEVAKVKDKYDLLRYDSSGAVSPGMFNETWLRYVVKMATGSGKTKVLSLLIAWSYFHKCYEADSGLARNFLLIAPNIIVLDRLRADFDGLRIFYSDPILPDNGYAERDWRDDFQTMTLHLQDTVTALRPYGNLFLTNIHRVYESGNSAPSVTDEDTSDYFLGKKPTGATNESKTDLGAIVRDIDELLVLNDEAHHIHDAKLAWFKSIQDIHNRLVMKGGKLALQLDVTATPKHENGAIFVQTVSDYPLVEAIHQNIVKHPVLPDAASRAKLQERQSARYTERFTDYIHLGYLEWKKAAAEHGKLDKKAVLFLMTDDTRDCDEVADYLRRTYPEFAGTDAVLVIHTKKNGEIDENAQGKKEEELKLLRDAANRIDSGDNPHRAVVSVLMLKEGWDVRNVTTIVGLRPYAAQSNILPEQTLGRGLRRMYRGEDVKELVSVVGTDAFMEFVESIKSEGIELEYRKMGEGGPALAPIVIEIDRENTKKDMDALDISVPVLTPRVYREYKNLSGLDPSKFGNEKLTVKEFSAAEQREIVFRDIVSGDITHTTHLDTDAMPDYQAVVGFFAMSIMKELRLVSGYDVLYGKVKEFIRDHLFARSIVLEDLNSLRNLSELEATRTIVETFRKQINALTVHDRGEAAIRDHIKISRCRPFVVKEQGYLVPKKSMFNKVVGDSHFELVFAGWLETCEDIVSYAKNYFAVHFKIDYRTADGSISDYYPDFFVKLSEKEVYIVETKGREDLDDVEKIKRLRQWCVDVNKLQKNVVYRMLLVRQDAWDKLPRPPQEFKDVIKLFKNE